MDLYERIRTFESLFNILQSVTGRIAKEQAVKAFEQNYPELKSDWVYILETLDNKHPIGWTFVPRLSLTQTPDNLRAFPTIASLIRYCECSYDKTVQRTREIETRLGYTGNFIAPIVNRTLRLGIGKSLLEKTDITPMLAKKYEGGSITGTVVVTEKLDGNRCLASYNPDAEAWEFYSRSGKPMKVDFDMTGFDTDFIYDGEVMSEAQTLLSMRRYDAILNDSDFDAETFDAQLMFNRTSGLINRKGGDKSLVFNVFDVVDDNKYLDRRELLASTVARGANVRILPTLYIGSDKSVISRMLGRMTQMGGEGIMLNRIDRGYEHRRTDALLKYKQVQYMDMEVTGYYGGTGKYTGMIGGLKCALETQDGKFICCDVGSGLSDVQRAEWMIDPQRIIGKIVQIGYHEITQSENNRGSNLYSLRFPRLIKVRADKSETSEF